ncbi:MAG: hypothetical protein ACREIF_00105, partial [Chthoniobacterales bacterium]
MKSIPSRIAGLAFVASGLDAAWKTFSKKKAAARQAARQKLATVAVLCFALAGATPLKAQNSSTLRWWHNVDNGYSFGETLGVHPTFVVTGDRPEYEGYYDMSGPNFAKRIYINSANEAAFGPFAASADVNHTPFEFVANTIVREGGNTPPMSISGGRVMQCGDVPYHDDDGQIPNNDPATNWTPTTYYISFNSGMNLTENDRKAGGNQCSAPPPMAQYSVHSMLVSLNIEDRPIRYSPPRGPAIDFIVTYNQKETPIGGAFTFSNLGPNWSFNWLAYVIDDPITQLPTTSVRISRGGFEAYVFNSVAQTFLPHPQSHATLVKTGAATYERLFPDGSKEVYAFSDSATSFPRRIFMTQVIDPAGNAATIAYDTSFRVTTITDALGRDTTISYEDSSDPLK